jgi:hypothetical protein
MKWGLRIFGFLDLLTFLIFIFPKTNYLLSTFELPFSIAQKFGAIWEIIVLLFFLLTAFFLFKKPKAGLIFSFIIVPFRISYIYFSLDILSYIAYYLGFSELISASYFQNYWFYVLIIFEVLRYILSLYWYSLIVKYELY